MDKKPFFIKKTRRNDGPSILHRAPFVNAITGGHSGRPRRKLFKRILKFLFVLGVFGVITGILGTAIVFSWISRDLPDPNKLLTRQVQKSTKIWDRTGKQLLYEIHGNQKRTLVELDQVSTMAIKATLSSEDRYFYEHKGFQLKSFVRAAAVAVLKGRNAQGTSTITQQLVKNAILSNVRVGIAGLTRKIKELILSYQIEQRFTKDQILKMYLNEIPYGSNIYGIEAAAQSFFGKNAKDLNAAEAALIAVLPKAPTRRSPYGTHKEELLWWQRFILDTMVEDGHLTKDQAEEAKKIDIISRVKPRRDAIFAPHYSLHVKELLAEKYGEREVEEGGLNVITSLDYEKQLAAEAAVTDGMEAVKTFGGSNASLVSLDPKTGQVLAMVGSADYFDKEHDGNVNVAMRNRQPGSSIKPIIYAAAFEKGYTPDTVLFDVNTVFKTDTEKDYEPKNYDLAEHGPVTMKKALAGSLNIPAVKTLYLVGVEKAIESAEKMGYSTFKDRSRFGLSLVLGGGEVKLIEHTAAYSVFATEGAYRAPSFILKVEDAGGTVLEEWKDEKSDGIIQTETARMMNDILSDNSARAYVFGEKNFLTLDGRPAGAKTGTTNGFHDAWTVGYTPNLVTGVWVGNNDNKAMKTKADGSRVAAPIWQAYMKKALETMPIEEFVKPIIIQTGKPVFDGQGGEIRVKVDKFSGKLATPATPPGAIEERVYRQAHSILHYVDRDDPRGPYPANPEQDIQYENWEKGVKDWADKNGWTVTEQPPTEIDETDRAGLAPIVILEEPVANSVLRDRYLNIRARADAPRGLKRIEYYLEDFLIGTADAWPWQVTITLPPSLGKGFYVIQARAFDDIENEGRTEVSINVQSDGEPFSFSWVRPTQDKTVRKKDFPFFVDASFTDVFGVASVDLVASATSGEAFIISSLKRPKTGGVSATWNDPPNPGEYALSAIMKFTNGTENRFPGPKLTIKP